MNLDVLYNEDCLAGMQRIPGGSIDMILCDLPYGTTRNKWDSVISLDLLWNHYRRLIKKNAAIVLTAQIPFSIVLGMSNIEWLKYEWIWSKDNSTGHLNCGYAPLKQHENVLVFSPAAASYVKDPCCAMNYNPQMSAGEPYATGLRGHGGRGNYDEKWNRPTRTVCSGKRFPKTILEFNVDRPSVHPTQKPVPLFEYLIRTYTNEGDTVLDNAMGSGTTAIACMNTGRHYVGFEKDPGYFQVAQKRITEHKPQMSLIA